MSNKNDQIVEESKYEDEGLDAIDDDVKNSNQQIGMDV
jgi:hypothetical protein